MKISSKGFGQCWKSDIVEGATRERKDKGKTVRECEDVMFF